jgi:hypothetical protein
MADIPYLDDRVSYSMSWYLPSFKCHFTNAIHHSLLNVTEYLSIVLLLFFNASIIEQVLDGNFAIRNMCKMVREAL